MDFRLRLAEPADEAALWDLIQCSVRELHRADYTQSQIEAALVHVFGVDNQLIADGTYFVVTPETDLELIVGCGGWSRRRTLFGGDQWRAREDSLLDPSHEAAKIRAFFVHPDWTRRGIASLLLQKCESAAIAGGFTRLEMGATLTGVQLYAARGYVEKGRSDISLGDGLAVPIVRMEKVFRSTGP